MVALDRLHDCSVEGFQPPDQVGELQVVDTWQWQHPAELPAIPCVSGCWRRTQSDATMRSTLVLALFVTESTRSSTLDPLRLPSPGAYMKDA
jgi:hypothetical protein